MSETHGNASDPTEPKTPLWLTAVGGVLFLLAGLLWALRTPAPDAADQAKTATTADAGAAAAPH